MIINTDNFNKSYIYKSLKIIILIIVLYNLYSTYNLSNKFNGNIITKDSINKANKIYKHNIDSVSKLLLISNKKYDSINSVVKWYEQEYNKTINNIKTNRDVYNSKKNDAIDDNINQLNDSIWSRYNKLYNRTSSSNKRHDINVRKLPKR